MKKLFIFDVDGVLFDLWTSMRPVFANYKGMSLSDADWDDIVIDFLHDPKPYAEFGEYFDHSEVFGNLMPLPGMKELVLKLQKNGFDLAIITGISNKLEQIEKRAANLREHYGSVFTEIACIGRGSSKHDALKSLAKGYDEVFFLDDNPQNVVTSREFVTHPIWMVNKHHEFMWEHLDQEGILMAENARDIKYLAFK